MMEPNPLAILALCVLGAGGLVLLFWLNHKWVTRHHPKTEAAPKKARASAMSYVVSYILGGAGPVNTFEEDEGDEGADRTGAHERVQWVEPPKITETYQAEPIAPTVRAPADEPFVSSHKLGRKSLTLLLAAQKDDEGKYLYSANKIAMFIGGTSAEVKGWVADVRGRKEPAATSIRRPPNGWGKASS